MKRALFVLGAGVAVCVVAAIQPTHTQSAVPAGAAAVVPVVAPAPARTVANVPMPTLTPEEENALAQRFAPERLAAIRARMQGDAQRAVRDQAENLFREPTVDEAAALAGTRTEGAGTESALPGGGAALKTDVSSLEFVKASVGKDGAIMTHDSKGVRRDQ